MSYDVIRSVRRLKDSGMGDSARLEYILDCLENGRHLYLSDQRYLESLLNSYGDVVNHSPGVKPTAASNLGKDLRDINERLEKILQYKVRDDTKGTGHILPPKTNLTARPSTIEGGKVTKTKSEDNTLVLSVVLGLVSLQGVGHIYIGKVAKGIGILLSSLATSIFSISYFLGFMKNSIPPLLNEYLPIILFAIYFGPYVYQVFDSRKLCATYNAYVVEHKIIPPWW